MISEKPSWIRHEGLQIFSIDIQPGGLRFATGGGDQKVRIWSMKSVDKDNANDDSSQRLLATMRDHFGSVNCVRWAKHGRYLASGSDDQVILIHERKAGSGTSEFGSGEPPDVENWKVIMTLRGHSADVVDLSWSPDDSTLASGSLDNTVHIWNMTNGICTAVLRGHSSLVKGVTWDPIGSFIASQSDDKTVIIWRTSDWSLAHKTEGHWSKSLGSTFFRRLAWSPCGNFISTTHGFQKPRHSAPLLERGKWSATFDFLGHNAPVVVVKFNDSMFRKNFSNGQDTKAAPVGWANGVSKTSTKEQPYNVIAIGSQDKTITIWTTASTRALFVAKKFFSQSVVDLSWSPDGYSLFACSLDGSVASFHFEAKELGYRLSDSEMDELKRSRYGDVRCRQSNLAESPAQFLLEQASAKQSAGQKGSSIAQPFQAPLKVSADVPKPAPVVQSKRVPEGDKKTAGPTTDDVNKANRLSSPVKQREYRHPDGQKTIIAVGFPSNQDNLPNHSQSQVVDFSSLDQRMNGTRPSYGSSGNCNNCEVRDRSGVTARANITESHVMDKEYSVQTNFKQQEGGGTLPLASEFRASHPSPEMISPKSLNKGPGRPKGQSTEEKQGQETEKLPHSRINKCLDRSLVGARIKVWWPDDEMFYKAVVESFDSDSKRHKVAYDDGDVEVLLLRNEKWDFISEEKGTSVASETTLSRHKDKSPPSFHPLDLICEAIGRDTQDVGARAQHVASVGEEQNNMNSLQSSKSNMNSLRKTVDVGGQGLDCELEQDLHEEPLNASANDADQQPQRSDEHVTKRPLTTSNGGIPKKHKAVAEMPCIEETGPVHSESRSAQANVNKQEATQGKDFSISRCLDVLEAMDDVPDGMKILASDVFRDAMNREMFLCYAPRLRGPWLKKELEKLHGSHRVNYNSVCSSFIKRKLHVMQPSNHQ
ncbi:unnamed protein product [Urochloa humidicola]